MYHSSGPGGKNATKDGAAEQHVNGVLSGISYCFAAIRTDDNPPACFPSPCITHITHSKLDLPQKKSHSPGTYSPSGEIFPVPVNSQSQLTKADDLPVHLKSQRGREYCQSDGKRS